MFWLQTMCVVLFPTQHIYRFNIPTTLLALPMMWPPLSYHFVFADNVPFILHTLKLFFVYITR